MLTLLFVGASLAIMVRPQRVVNMCRALNLQLEVETMHCGADSDCLAVKDVFPSLTKDGEAAFCACLAAQGGRPGGDTPDGATMLACLPKGRKRAEESHRVYYTSDGGVDTSDDDSDASDDDDSSSSSSFHSSSSTIKIPGANPNLVINNP